MRRQSFIAPFLWIEPRDVIVGAEPEGLARYLAAEAGCDTWVLDDDSLAYSFPDVLVDWGMSLDYPRFLEKTKLVNKLLAGKIKKECDAVVLDVPDVKYWTQVSLSPGESETQQCCYMKSILEQWEPFAFKAAAPFPLTSSTRKHVRTFLEDWIEKMSSGGAQGEVLQLGKVTVAEYFHPGNPKMYPQDGFVVTCSSYVPCTWPWIALYLSMRKHLPAKQRLSVEFFNPGVPRKPIDREIAKDKITHLKFGSS